jgi:hypothetical protein
MPAEFTVYVKISDLIKPPTILYESPDKSYSVYKRIVTLYNTDSLATAIEIGIRTIMYTSIMNDLTNNINSVTVYDRFNELSGLPNGDDNILVVNGTRYGDIYINKVLKDGVYTNIVNTSQSTGEYANQVGYLTFIKDSTKTFASLTFKFPLPILTYTDYFNSLPQKPSTAPLPA